MLKRIHFSGNTNIKKKKNFRAEFAQSDQEGPKKIASSLFVYGLELLKFF